MNIHKMLPPKMPNIKMTAQEKEAVKKVWDEFFMRNRKEEGKNENNVFRISQKNE